MHRRATPWILIGTMLCGGATFAMTRAVRSVTPGASRAALAAEPHPAAAPHPAAEPRRAVEPDPAAAPRPVDRVQWKREAIDEMASMTMDRLLSQSPQAKRLFNKSAGYAVFDNFKVAILISGGGGVGVAVERATRQKTYMKMGTAGIGLGVGGHSYGVVFLFEDEETMHLFVEGGWHADATAAAAFWSKGRAADASFSHGVAVYQLTNKGLIANVDISGTKYWKQRKLNQAQQTLARAPGDAAVGNEPRPAPGSARAGAPSANQRRTSHR